MPKAPKSLKRPWVNTTPRQIGNGSKGWSGEDIYHTVAWRKDRAAHLRAFPLCAECLRKGFITSATVSDHITPISQGGDVWHWSNRQALCNTCHMSKSARESHTNRLKP